MPYSSTGKFIQKMFYSNLISLVEKYKKELAYLLPEANPENLAVLKKYVKDISERLRELKTEYRKAEEALLQAHLDKVIVPTDYSQYSSKQYYFLITKLESLHAKNRK